MKDIEIQGAELLSDRMLDDALKHCRRRGSSRGLVIDPMRARLTKMKKTVITAARLIQDRIAPQGGREVQWQPAMLTLTYENVSDWQPDHIRNLLTTIRNWLARRGYSFYYVWTAELQKRGAVHYHIVVWLPRLGPGRWNFLKLPKVDQNGWWKYGSSKVHFAKRAVGYLAKYASKGDDLPSGSKFPKGLRLYGVGGVLKSERVVMRWWRSPPFAREALGPDADIRKVKDGYQDATTGNFVRSPWEFVCLYSGFPFFIHRSFDLLDN